MPETSRSQTPVGDTEDKEFTISQSAASHSHSSRTDTTKELKITIKPDVINVNDTKESVPSTSASSCHSTSDCEGNDDFQEIVIEKVEEKGSQYPSNCGQIEEICTRCDIPPVTFPHLDNKLTSPSSLSNRCGSVSELSTSYPGIPSDNGKECRVTLASAETLTSHSSPRSLTSSNLLQQLPPTCKTFAEATVHHILTGKPDVKGHISNNLNGYLPTCTDSKNCLHHINIYCENKALIRRSWSLIESRALAKSSESAFHHKKSPSHGAPPPFVDNGGAIHIHLAPHRSLDFEIGAHQRCSNKCEKNAKGIFVQDVSSCSGSEQDPGRRRRRRRPLSFSSGIGEPSVYHALVVIFLEFFAWGLLTSPMILVLKDTFPDHTFLMNGIIMGIKGLLSFLSAPLIGALSDVWGRKFFLFVTVFFTCLPIPFMKIDTWWYFALISMSGVFAVTYSIIFAYVADVTDPAERHHAYGLVSATFAASLVTSPALGAYLSQVHSDDLVVGLATAIAVLDIFFILVAVPESLPEKLRLSNTWSATQISWEQADPFSTLWKVSKDKNIMLISLTVFLSYLPEAGQLSCFFVYLQLVMGFGPEMVATFIAVVGILSVLAQTALLGLLINKFSNKRVIIIGLAFELLQLMWYGFGSKAWMMWAAGVLAAVSSITYPAISSYVSTHTDIDKQGVVQGIVTGMRGLCAGLGPAVFGFIFYLFHVDLNRGPDQNTTLPVPGPPFVFGAMLVLLALTVSAFIPETTSVKIRRQSGAAAASSLDLGFGRDHKKTDNLDDTSQPLMNESVVL